MTEKDELRITIEEMRSRAVKATKDPECLGSLRNCELALSVIDKSDKILERLNDAN